MDNSIHMSKDLISKEQAFSIRSRIKSFYYAGVGVGQFFREEHNARIHLAGSVVVALMGWWLNVSHTEAIALVIVTGLVWVAEMLNTCIEKAMDFITLERRPEIKVIKDLAAGAVLIAAIIAVIVGSIIFIPKLL